MKKESGNNRRERTMRKIIIVLLAMLMLSMNMAAQVMTLTLDSCRALAVNNNKELQRSVGRGGDDRNLDDDVPLESAELADDAHAAHYQSVKLETAQR